MIYEAAKTLSVTVSIDAIRIFCLFLQHFSVDGFALIIFLMAGQLP